MLNVWSVCVGDKYKDEDVLILKEMVSRHLTIPYKFNCLSDRKIHGVETTISPVDWPGWWQKLALFLVETKQSLYLDLDCVVVGDLTRLISNRLSMSKNWAQSGHGGCQSSVMSWGKDYRFLAFDFDPKKLTYKGERGGVSHYGLYGPKQLWGDQEYICDVMGAPGESEIIPMNHIYSFKYHCRQSVPEDASVIAFHGNPKPSEVNAEWVRRERSYTAIAV